MDIKVRDLKQTETIENENKLMVLVDDDSNLVKNITKEEFLTNVISSTENNALVQETDGNLYVNTSEIADKVNTIESDIGDLSDLTTTDKTNLVAAINEAAQSSGSGGHNVGEIVPALLPLTDAGLHILDGTRLPGEGIYGEFVQYIADLYAEKPNANYFTTESAWQSSVSTYGSCGKFVYDSELNTVRLPKVSDILQCTTDLNALGDLIASGLPQHTHTRGTMNIKGKFGTASQSQFWTASGAFSQGSGYTGNGVNSSGNIYVNFDASKSWTGSTSNANYTSTVATSSKVQPQTVKCFVYIVIATSAKTDIEADIDEIAIDLNGKADVDFTNCTDVADIKMAHNAMPSDTYIDLTLNASGSLYTAPADGYFMCRSDNRANADVTYYIYMYSTYLASSQHVKSSQYGGGTSTDILVWLPIKKGNSISIYHNLPSTMGANEIRIFRFVYAVGSESEAQ